MSLVKGMMRMSGFNGAAEIHRRKSPTVQTIAASLPYSFNGAAEIHRRKFVSPIQQGIAETGFNGAAEIHRRK